MLGWCVGIRLVRWSQGGDDDDGVPRIIFQGVQAQVPLRPGMKYSRKGKPLTPTSSKKCQKGKYYTPTEDEYRKKKLKQLQLARFGTYQAARFGTLGPRGGSLNSVRYFSTRFRQFSNSI